jgi:hypothetical protein
MGLRETLGKSAEGRCQNSDAEYLYDRSNQTRQAVVQMKALLVPRLAKQDRYLVRPGCSPDTAGGNFASAHATAHNVDLKEVYNKNKFACHRHVKLRLMDMWSALPMSVLCFAQVSCSLRASSSHQPLVTENAGIPRLRPTSMGSACTPLRNRKNTRKMGHRRRQKQQGLPG